MIKEILDELDNIGLQKKIKRLVNRENVFIAYLICMKYLCEIGEYHYEEVIENNSLYEIFADIRKINRFYLGDCNLPVNRILIQLKKFNTKELLLEFLETMDKPIYWQEDKERIAFLNIEKNPFPFYYQKGNVTYISNMITNDWLGHFKIFDKILGIENHYLFINDVEIEKYDYIYLFDDKPKLSSLRANLFNHLRTYILHNNNIVLITNYNKISNFRDGIFLIRYIQTIIIEGDKTTICFKNQKEENEITIINYQKERIKDIQKVIKNNRKQKDVLIKVTHKELIENNYRIGFNLYQLEKTSKIIDINKIVDENTRYLKKLNSINEQVEREINKLLNR